MTTLPPDHPPVKLASSDMHFHSFWRDAGRWIGAGVFVLTVHAAGAYAVHLAQEDDQPEGAQVAAMVVELAPEPMAPVEEQVSEEPQKETAEIPQEAEPEPKEVTPPEPEPEPEPAEQAEEVIPDVVEAEKAEIAVPKPAEKPKVKPEPKPEPKKVEKPKPEKPKPEKVEKAKPKLKKAEKAAKTRQASAPRMDVDNGAKAAANRRGENSASSGVNTNKWTAKMNAHMQRNTRFMQRKARNAKGRVVVNFVIDPSGNVLSVKLAGSSGNPAVDQLALEAARRASPVPAPPPAIAKARMPITLPLLFK
ncbi:TonB family protein [Ochrobactrum sp. CM-21-5]|nr:energy transducer TonB [Ochrobactrum sp. CM-21-5]MBC2886886.1 TonB family protein [Ochrobactrum sp. CM-21-5]